jgi:hypothetical protein
MGSDVPGHFMYLFTEQTMKAELEDLLRTESAAAVARS